MLSRSSVLGINDNPKEVIRFIHFRETALSGEQIILSCELFMTDD